MSNIVCCITEFHIFPHDWIRNGGGETFRLFVGDIKRRIDFFDHASNDHPFFSYFILIPFSLAQKSTRHFLKCLIDEKNFFSKCLPDGAHRVWNEFEMIQMIERVVFTCCRKKQRVVDPR